MLAAQLSIELSGIILKILETVELTPEQKSQINETLNQLH